MAETLAVVGQEVRLVAQDFVAAQQQLGEIHQAGPLAGFLVSLVDALHLFLERIVAVAQMAGAAAFVLLRVDEPQRLLGRPTGVVDFHGLHQALDQAQLVVRIEDLEAFGQAGFAPVAAQQSMGQTVERADPQAGGGQLQQAFHPAAHFAGGFVGEGHRQQAVRRYAFHPDQPGDAVHEYACLAAARAGQNEGGALGGGDGFPLGGV